RAQDCKQLVSEFREIKEPVCRRFYNWSGPAEDTFGHDQFERVEYSTARIALITSCRFKTAMRTFSFDEAVRKKALILFAVGQIHTLGVHIPIVVHFTV